MMTTILSGLALGSLYGIIAMMLTITLVRSGLINVALPFYLILGCYLITVFDSIGWSYLLIFLALAAIGAVVGSLQEYLTVRPTQGRHDAAFISVVGVAIIIEGIIYAIWGADPAGSVTFFAGTRDVDILGGTVAPYDLWLIGLLVAMALVLEYAVRRTRWGILGRAATTDQMVALLRGINVPILRLSAFAISSAVAFTLALVAAPKIGVAPGPALEIMVFGFTAAAIGGFGSFSGAAVGGLVVGLAHALGARYLSVSWVPILIFAVLCAVLLLRPVGLRGGAEGRTI